MCKILAAVLLGLSAFLPLPALADAPNWTIYTDPDGIFTAEVPQPPVLSTAEQDNLNGVKVEVKKYLVDRGSSALIIIVSRYEGLDIDDETALDRSVKGTQTEGRTLDSDDPVVVSGHTGRSLVLRDTSGNLLTDRLFFFDHTLYQAITSVVPGTPDDVKSEANRFAQAFQFLH